MNRSIVYSQEQGRSTDFLFAQRAAMIGLAKLSAIAMGTSTVVNGLACSPTSPASMQVQVGPGDIYSVAPVDATAYGILSADTTHSILKQGISLDTTTLNCPAPGTAGYSINYLVQVAYQDSDTNNVVLPYFNSANPSQPLSGQNNSGTAQATERDGIIAINAKAGAAAPTGTQTTPAPDVGYTGLYVVTVANGAATITSANISTLNTAPILPTSIVQAIQSNSFTYGADIGAANAYIANFAPAITSISDDTVLSFKAAHANTGASTFTPNALTSKPIVNSVGNALVGGEITANSIVTVQWNSSIGSGSWVLLGVAQLAASSGAGDVGFLPSGTGAEATTLETKNRESMSNLDFIPDAEKAAILAGTSTYDATVAVQKAIDAAGSTRRLRWLGAVNCGALSSSASVDWVFDEGAKIVQIPAVYGLTTYHITLSGPRVRLENYNGDGNQSAMVSTQGSNGLLISGVSPTLINPKSKNYNGLGIEITSSNFGVKRGLVIGGSFDDNAGLGLQTQAASYVDFMDTTFSRNGYGFQKTRANYADTSHGFVAFGVAVRLRSHHINFIGCAACDNGRDGININQGSYAIKHIGVLAYGNDDGGFTIAADNLGSGLPGEGESCYDIEYNGCEAYNNYTGGLVAYAPAHNVTVKGGRYYNNHRLAGNLAFASSYFNGIYFAGGSTGINVDAKCYDDRQTRAITAVTQNGGSPATATLTASGWVSGTMNYYPKVGIYDGNMTFLGYGQITAESAGSVTIKSTANNGVTLASLAATQYVSQCVQHNGLFADNASTGQVHIDGYGHKQGAAGTGLTGFPVISGYTAGGQNIWLPKAYRDSTQLLANPTFDANVANWTFSLGSGTGAAANYYTGATKRSPGALQLIGGSTGDTVGDSTLIASAESYTDLQFVEFNVWAWAQTPGAAYALLFWGSTPVSEIVRHPGGGQWKLLRISAMIPSGSANLFVRLGSLAANTVYFDSADLRAVYIGSDDRDYAPTSRYLPY